LSSGKNSLSLDFVHVEGRKRAAHAEVDRQPPRLADGDDVPAYASKTGSPLASSRLQPRTRDDSRDRLSVSLACTPPRASVERLLSDGEYLSLDPAAVHSPALLTTDTGRRRMERPHDRASIDINVMRYGYPQRRTE
jgi:hypothetical protein